jgi:hypothetical protein
MSLCAAVVKRRAMAAVPFFFDFDPDFMEIDGISEACANPLAKNTSSNEAVKPENITESKAHRFNSKQHFIDEIEKRIVEDYSRLSKNYKKQCTLEESLDYAKWKVCQTIEKINKKLTPKPGQSVWMVTLNLVHIDAEAAKRTCQKIIAAMKCEYWVRFVEPTADGLPHFHMLVLANSEERIAIAKAFSKIREKIGFYSGLNCIEVEYENWKRPRPDWWPPLLGYSAKYAYNLSTIVAFRAWLRMIGQDWYSQSQSKPDDEWGWEDDTRLCSVPYQHPENDPFSPPVISAAGVPPSTSSSSLSKTHECDDDREPLLPTNSFDYLTTTAQARRSQRLADEDREQEGRDLNDLLSIVVPAPPPIFVVDPLLLLINHPAFDSNIPPSKQELKDIINNIKQQRRAAALIPIKALREKENERLANAKEEVEALICLHYPTNEVSKFRGRLNGLSKSLDRLRDFPGVEAFAQELAETYKAHGDLTAFNLHPSAKPCFASKEITDTFIQKITNDISILSSKKSKITDKRKALENIKNDLRELAEYDHYLKVARVFLDARQILTDAQNKLQKTEWPTQGHVDFCNSEISSATTKKVEKKWRAALKEMEKKIKLKSDLEIISSRLMPMLQYHRKATRQGHWLRTNGLKKSWSKIAEMLLCYDFVREKTRAKNALKRVRKDPIKNKGTELGALEEDIIIQQNQDRAAAKFYGIEEDCENLFMMAA